MSPMVDVAQLRIELANAKRDASRFRRGMFAANRAQAQLEVARGVNAALAGNAEGARRHAGNGNGIEPYSLNDQAMRLAGFKAQLDMNRGEGFANMVDNAKEFLKNYSATTEEHVEGSEAQLQFEAVSSVVRGAKAQCGEIACIICHEPISKEKMFLGKNCYHLVCSDCVLQDARHNAPLMGDFTIWLSQMDGTRLENPEKIGQFPATGKSRCPQCRDADFCDKAFFGVNAKARDQVLSGALTVFVGELSPEEEILQERKNMHLYVLRAGDDTKKMLVAARVPYDKNNKLRAFGPANGSFSAFNSTHLFKDAGWKWDRDGSVVGGRAWYKDVESQEPTDTDVGGKASLLPEFDELPAGAVLRKTFGNSWTIDLPFQCMTDQGRAAHVARTRWTESQNAEKKMRADAKRKAQTQLRVAQENVEDATVTTTVETLAATVAARSAAGARVETYEVPAADKKKKKKSMKRARSVIIPAESDSDDEPVVPAQHSTADSSEWESE